MNCGPRQQISPFLAATFSFNNTNGGDNGSTVFQQQQQSTATTTRTTPTSTVECPIYYLETALRNLLSDLMTQQQEQEQEQEQEREQQTMPGHNLLHMLMHLDPSITIKRLPGIDLLRHHNGRSTTTTAGTTTTTAMTRRLLSSPDHWNLIAYYVYCDMIPRELFTCVPTAISVYCWALGNRAPEHFLHLLLMHIVMNITQETVVQSLQFCCELSRTMMIPTTTTTMNANRSVHQEASNGHHYGDSDDDQDLGDGDDEDDRDRLFDRDTVQERLNKLEGHCLRYILQLINDGKVHTVRHLESHTELHSTILFRSGASQLIPLVQTSHKSTYKTDVQQLFHESQGLLHIQLSKGMTMSSNDDGENSADHTESSDDNENDIDSACSSPPPTQFISLPAIVLCANSEYIRTLLLSSSWSSCALHCPSVSAQQQQQQQQQRHIEHLPLYLYGLDEEQYDVLCEEEKHLRRMVLHKFLSLLFYVSVELSLHEAILMLDLCNFLLLDRDHFIYDKCIHVMEQHVHCDNVLCIAQRLSDLVQAQQQQPERMTSGTRAAAAAAVGTSGHNSNNNSSTMACHTLNNKVIQTLAESWTEIRRRHSREELLEYLPVDMIMQVTDRLAEQESKNKSFQRQSTAGARFTPLTGAQLSSVVFDSDCAAWD